MGWDTVVEIGGKDLVLHVDGVINGPVLGEVVEGGEGREFDGFGGGVGGSVEVLVEKVGKLVD